MAEKQAVFISMFFIVIIFTEITGKTEKQFRVNTDQGYNLAGKEKYSSCLRNENTQKK